MKLEKDDEDESYVPKESDDNPEEVMEKIRNKLKSSRTNVQHSGGLREKEKPKVQEIVRVSDSDSDEFGNELEKERQRKRKKKA